ncbi:MAG: HEPN domain-containing protein [Thaumarchaeota archaeon]|nr:HEPN domain-containing protein [Nitrososphaerota archaeon]
MQPDKQYLKWCAKQKKGIKLVRGSANLQTAYLKKSKEALRSMEANAEKGIDEWVVSTSYYARYFAIYALLSRIGIKCEIHDCTIALFSYLFADKIPSKLMEDLKQAKDDRIEAQYYTETIRINPQTLANTKEFVLKVEEIIDNLTNSEVTTIQGKLQTIL